MPLTIHELVPGRQATRFRRDTIAQLPVITRLSLDELPTRLRQIIR